jgi:hypothetical protein
VPSKDVHLVFWIDLAEVSLKRGLPRQGPLELTRKEGFVEALTER